MGVGGPGQWGSAPGGGRIPTPPRKQTAEASHHPRSVAWRSVSSRGLARGTWTGTLGNPRNVQGHGQTWPDFAHFFSWVE